MDQQPDSPAPAPHRIDAAAKARFLEALRDGASRDEAAAGAGFTAAAFYNFRETDPVFRHAWAWALELSAIDGRALAAAKAPPPEGAVIAPNANRPLQLRTARRRRFDDRRKRVFLDHFAGTADAHAAAAAAGIGYSTVVQHRLKDADFAARCDEALAVAYAALHEEAVRQRLEAQQHIREGLCPAGEVSKEFDRVMQLLARYTRPGGRVGFREVGEGRARRWSFDDAIQALDRAMRGMGIRHGIEAEPILLPPPANDQGKAP